MNKIFSNLIKRVIIAIALFCITLFGNYEVENELKFNRVGVWVIRYSMTNKNEIDRFVDFAKENGITDLFVQIRGRGDAFYNSELVEKSEKIYPHSFDPLKYVCKIAKKNNIKIHAWFNTYILFSNTDRKLSPNHLFKLFPEWTETNIYGQNDYNLIYSEDVPTNYEGVYLSPIHQDVNKYLLLLIKEIMDNYDIDGIHLDYVRYQTKNSGFNKNGMEFFSKNSNLNVNDYLVNGKYYKNDSLKKFFFDKYSEYRIEAINKLIKQISDLNKRNNKKIEISSAVKPNPIIARNNYYQDWLTWIKNDWVDFVVPMNYAINNLDFNNNMLVIKDNLTENEYKKVMIGIGIWRLSPKESHNRINSVVDQDFDGIVFFSYNTLKNGGNYFEKMVSNN